MKDLELITAVIEQLSRVEARPRTFISDLVPETVNYLSGLHLIMQYYGFLEPYLSIHEKVVLERGWTTISAHQVEEMQEAGLSQEDIDREILKIEIETWKRVEELLQSKFD